MRIRNL